jgi:ferritin
MNKKIEELLNSQVEKEGYSSNLYLAMASWAEAEGYAGISKWLYAQAEEEHVHMLRLLHYINDRDGRAIIPTFQQPPVGYDSINKLFEDVYAHERHITASINQIVDLTFIEKDYTTHQWVQWYVTEQIEEEKMSRVILDKLKLLGNDNLYLFDRDILLLRRKISEKKAED